MLVMVFAVCTAAYLKIEKFSFLAHDHYCESLDSAYRAVALHIRDSVAERDNLYSECEYEEWIPVVDLDRETLDQTRDLWEDSINSTAKKNHYWRLHNKPWLMLTPEPQKFYLPPLPPHDSELSNWWNKNIRSYIKTNKLHHDVNSSMLVENNIDIAKIGFKNKNRTKRFFDLDDLLPNETATTRGKNQ